jgi:hypothetical protein
MFTKLRWTLAALCLASGMAAAADAGKRPLNADDINKDALDHQMAKVRSDMGPKGRFEFVTATERAQVEKDLETVEKLLEGHTSINELTGPQKTALFNAQEHANGILAKRDGEQLICESKPPLGSHRSQTTCQTYREREIAKQHARDQMEKLQTPGPLNR